MTSSTSSSSKWVSRLAAGLAAAVLGCGHGQARAPAPPERLRVAFLPIENITGGQAPTKDLAASLERAVARHVDVVSGDIVDGFLARHRIRYTGGIDREGARAAKDELGVDGVLITSLEMYRATPPRLGLAMRLVAAGGDPVILWIDSHARAGDESPGLLGLGVVEDMKRLQSEEVAQLVGSLGAFVEGRHAAAACGASGRFAPKVRFRSPALDAAGRPLVAVVPFLNQTARRGAGEAVALEFVRQLVDSGAFRVLEPGVVRDLLLRYRIIMQGGVHLEATRLMLGALEVDLVLGGIVLDYEDKGPVPKVRFTATMLEGGSGEVTWASSSYNQGDDGVWFFGIGQVATVGDLTCRMVASVAERMVPDAARARKLRRAPEQGGGPSMAVGAQRAVDLRAAAAPEPSR